MRGATAHFDAVVSGATSGVLNAATATGVPVIFCVMTTDTMEQVCCQFRLKGCVAVTFCVMTTDNMEQVCCRSWLRGCVPIIFCVMTTDTMEQVCCQSWLRGCVPIIFCVLTTDTMEQVLPALAPWFVCVLGCKRPQAHLPMLRATATMGLVLALGAVSVVYLPTKRSDIVSHI